MEELIDLLNLRAVGIDRDHWELTVYPDTISLVAGTKETYTSQGAAFEAAGDLLANILALGHTLAYLSRIGVYTHTNPSNGPIEWRGTIDVRLDSRE